MIHQHAKFETIPFMRSPDNAWKPQILLMPCHRDISNPSSASSSTSSFNELLPSPSFFTWSRSWLSLGTSGRPTPVSIARGVSCYSLSPTVSSDFLVGEELPDGCLGSLLSLDMCPVLLQLKQRRGFPQSRAMGPFLGNCSRVKQSGPCLYLVKEKRPGVMHSPYKPSCQSWTAMFSLVSLLSLSLSLLELPALVQQTSPAA